MPDYPISLDNSSSEYGSPMKMEGPRKNYPCLNLHWNASYDLPEDGTMTVKFHKKNQTDTTGDNGTSQSLELEILSIESVKAAKPNEAVKKDRDVASDALDAALEESTVEDY